MVFEDSEVGSGQALVWNMRSALWSLTLTALEALAAIAISDRKLKSQPQNRYMNYTYLFKGNTFHKSVYVYSQPKINNHKINW